MVHERFTGEELRDYRSSYEDIQIIAHPECPPDVLAEADFVGSTAGMINWVGDNKPARVVMVTECSMSDNVAVEHPDVDFIRPCNLWPPYAENHAREHSRRAEVPAVSGRGQRRTSLNAPALPSSACSKSDGRTDHVVAHPDRQTAGARAWQRCGRAHYCAGKGRRDRCSLRRRLAPVAPAPGHREVLQQRSTMKTIRGTTPQTQFVSRPGWRYPTWSRCSLRRVRERSTG